MSAGLISSQGSKLKAKIMFTWAEPTGYNTRFSMKWCANTVSAVKFVNEEIEHTSCYTSIDILSLALDKSNMTHWPPPVRPVWPWQGRLTPILTPHEGDSSDDEDEDSDSDESTED
jgi:hypothetical protein